MASTRGHTDPFDWARLASKPRPEALLIARRKLGSWSQQDLSTADGTWRPDEVDQLERRESWPTWALMRYMRALGKLEGRARESA